MQSKQSLTLNLNTELKTNTPPLERVASSERIKKKSDWKNIIQFTSCFKIVCDLIPQILLVYLISSLITKLRRKII